MKGVNFSDPQGRKEAYRMAAAAAKNHIRMYFNEGNDIMNAQQMKEAWLSYGEIKGVHVAAVECLEERNLTIGPPKIPRISKLNNFRFENGKLVDSGAYNVGNGKQVALNLTSGERTQG